MASSKRTKNTSSRRVLRFPEAKGKIIAEVELSLSPDHNIIEIVFEDKTALNFELEPCFYSVESVSFCRSFCPCNPLPTH
jgi:hypothetical protein